MGSESNLRKWQIKRLGKLKDGIFPKSRYFDELTLVIYTFPPAGREEECFRWIECSILQTWSVLGALSCVIVAHKHFPALDRFLEKHSDVKAEIEPGLTPGKIATMSYDCNAKLHQRFDTPYCLIIQDDGFPLRDTLGEFLGKWDYIGAPLVRTGIRRTVANFLHLATMNGGFSLRSRAFCAHVSEQWFRFWRHFLRPDSFFFAEDVFYTTVARLFPPTRLRFRFPDEKTAFRFSVDLLDGYVKQPEQPPPFGFHGRYTADFYLPEETTCPPTP